MGSGRLGYSLEWFSRSSASPRWQVPLFRRGMDLVSVSRRTVQGLFPVRRSYRGLGKIQAAQTASLALLVVGADSSSRRGLRFSTLAEETLDPGPREAANTDVHDGQCENALKVR